MSTVVVRYQTRADAAEENQRLIEQVFAQLTADDPGEVKYAAFRLADGVSFVHVAVVDGENNPLPELAAFKEFQSTIGDRCTEPPVPEPATLIGTYRFPLSTDHAQ